MEFGVGDAEDFGFGLEGEDGFGFGVSFGVGFGFGFGFGVGVGFGVGFGVASGFVSDVGVGFADGSSVGVGFGVGFGVGATGEAPPDTGPLGAGELEPDERFVTCSGITASEGKDGKDSPTDVTVLTVNVYGSPFVSDPKRNGEEVTDLVSPVSTTVMMYPVIAAPLPVAPLNSRLTLLFPGVPVTTVGAFGVPAGVPTIPFELAPRPTPFSAATVNV